MVAEDSVTLTGTVLDENVEISLRELCRSCGVNAEYVIEMVEQGVIDPHGPSPREWRFPGPAVRRVQIALRLQQDLRINLSGAALVLDLLEELEALRRRSSGYGASIR
jgi:chaperone modulatory protein CbpM